MNVRECEECEESVDEVAHNVLVGCYFCAAMLCLVCNYDHFINHQLAALESEHETDSEGEIQMSTATAEKQLYSRNKLVASLLRIKHDAGDLETRPKRVTRTKRDNVTKLLDVYKTDALAAAKTDPELFAHFIAWNQKHGKVRDSKVAFPPLALRGLNSGDDELAENAIAHMMLLAPRELVRSYDFSILLTKSGLNIPGGYRRTLERGIRQYLRARELNSKWFERTVLADERSLRFLYQLAHMKPTPYAQRILFDRDYPKGSVFAKVNALPGMNPKEAATVIIDYNVPFQRIVSWVVGTKNKDLVLALIEGMTGNQIITNTAMLQKLGVMDDAALKSAYEAALARARTDKKTETLKAGRAAAQVAGTEAAVKLEQLQVAKTEQLGNIEGDWLILGDRSSSMSNAIEVARKIASFITERVAGSVYLVFFNSSPVFFDVSGKSYSEILELTKRVSANGSTSIGCGLDYLLSRKVVVNGIAIVSDGGDNSAPRFEDAYKKYAAALEVEPDI